MQKKTKTRLLFWAFTGPLVLAFFIVVALPFLWGIYYSFTEWNGIVKSQAEWVGFSNYLELFSDDEFSDAFWFTVRFSAVSVILINALGFLLALLVTQPLKSANTLRTVFFMPNLIGGLILGFIWQFIFIQVFSSLADALSLAFLHGWLATPETGFWGLVILMTWQMAGYVMVIYIAALQSIPGELLEAAEIDGSSIYTKTRYIIMPLVAPAFTINMFLMLSNCFKLYDQNLSLTNGGPFNSTQMLAMNIYNTAFKFDKMGEAQAKAVIFFIIVAFVSLVQVRYTKRREVEY
ncbi:MAG: sugar ABC transporter permease [Spirochaetales bacterium]|nr:sugar ABC transporter permease [Spirochaetales bacterium]